MSEIVTGENPEPFKWSSNPVERLQQERELREKLAAIEIQQAALEQEATLLQWALQGYEAAEALKKLRSPHC